MSELTEKAIEYATEKTNKIIIDAIAKAYADGYRDGYKDREEENPVDLSSDETEFVDLGLPSGTLWAADYERKEGYIIYLPYGKASQFCIPTEAQWKELRESCRWEFEYHRYELKKAKCVGPNGNFLEFRCTGKEDVDSRSLHFDVFFWLVDTREQADKNAVRMYNSGRGNSPMRERGEIYVSSWFSGYKLPIRLVRTK